MALEDYTTYTEVDTGNDRIQKTANHVDHLATRNEDTYLYKDKDVGHFTDFTHKVDAKSDFAINYAIGAVWMLSNDLDDIYGLYNTNKTCILAFMHNYGNANRIRLWEIHASGIYADDSVVVSANTTYYLLIKKTGTALKCGIYSTAELRDAGDATDGDVDNLALTLQADHSFRYVFACNTYNSGHAISENNDIDNLDLQEVPAFQGERTSVVPIMQVLEII